MAVLDTPETRRKIIDMMWDLAYRRMEGHDSNDIPPDATEVWDQFKTQLEEIGLELTVIHADGSEATVPMELIEEATRGGRG